MKSSASVAEILKDVAARLEPVSESPRLDAEILLGRAIDMPRSYFFAHPEDVPDDGAIERLEKTVARRLAGEPMAYITGIKEFWSMELLVTPATLVPRPETEILVDRALMHIPRKAEWRVLDLGTGSGAIALAIARERPHCDVVATDISADAVRVAEANAREHSLPNVSVLEGSWTEPVSGQVFNVIVSNPPYVESNDPALHALTAEPLSALAAGEDGLDAIRVLAADCLALLTDDGLLAIEHGSEQQDAVAELLGEHGWQAIECHKDYAGLPRVTTARKTC